jgi:O-acetyl-ADP-ribose deacetylase (regulator of RNase III)
MPAISSGIFGFPKDRCAQIIIGQSAGFLKENPSSSLETVEFCIFDEGTLTYFKDEFDKIQ